GRRREALPVARRPDVRLRLHLDAGSGALDAGEPRRGLDELPVFVLLGVLTGVPNVAVVVLGKEGELRLDQLPAGAVAVPDDDVADASDDLDEVGDDEVQPLLAVARGARVHETRPGLQRQPVVVDRRRVVEVVGIKGRWRLRAGLRRGADARGDAQ